MKNVSVHLMYLLSEAVHNAAKDRGIAVSKQAWGWIHEWFDEPVSRFKKQAGTSDDFEKADLLYKNYSEKFAAKYTEEKYIDLYAPWLVSKIQDKYPACFELVDFYYSEEKDISSLLDRVEAALSDDIKIKALIEKGVIDDDGNIIVDDMFYKESIGLRDMTCKLKRKDFRRKMSLENKIKERVALFNL